MSLFGAALAAFAVWLWCPNASANRLYCAKPELRRRGQRSLIPACCVGVAVGMSWLVWGRAGAVVGIALSAVSLTIWIISRRRVASKKARDRHIQFAQAALALAGEVDVGKVPREALAIVAQDYPLLAEPLAAAQLGGNVADSLRQLALIPGTEGASELAAAWQLGEQVGAPLAMSFRQVATSLTQQRALSRVVTGELAGPRATGRLLAGLPLAGLGLGYGLGGDPLRFLLTNLIGNALLLAGVALTCVGLLWSERLADKAGA